MPRGAERGGPGGGRFSTTRWSVVVAAGDSRHPDHRRALAELCTDYWYPVYAFVRRRGWSSDAAQDLTQGFFSQLLEKHTMKAADRERGRFRSFLLAALKYYLSHERERSAAQKRSGDQTAIPLDAATAEGKYRLEPADPETPESLFERRWALLLLERALDRLREESRASAHPERSLKLVGHLTGDDSAPGYRQLAAGLGMTESAVKVTMHRLRSRYRQLIREEVRQTVNDPAEIDDELRHLFAVLGNC